MEKSDQEPMKFNSMSELLCMFEVGNMLPSEARKELKQTFRESIKLLPLTEQHKELSPELQEVLKELYEDR